MNKKFLSNMNWIIISKVFQMVLGFFVGIYSARYLGPTNYGVINYASSYIAFFTVLTGLGIDNYIMKALIDHKDKQGEVLGSSVILHLASSIVCVIALIAILNITDANDTVILTVALLQALNLVFSALQLLAYWYQIQLKSKTPAIITSIGYAVMTIYRIAILIQAKDVRFFAFTSALETLVIAGLLLFQYKRDNGPRLSFNRETCKEILKNSYQFIFSGLMVVIFNQTDKIMLKQLLDESAVGYYSIANNLCNTWTFILVAIIQSASPLILEAKQKSDELYRRRIKQCYAAIIWISVAVSIVFTVGAKWIVMLLYGTKYINSITPLRILPWAVLFSYLGVARNPWIVSEGLQKYVKYLTFIGAIFNVILNAVLIPSYGAVGASIATLITQFLVNFGALFFFKALRPNATLIIESFQMKNVIKKQTIIDSIKDLLNRKMPGE